MYAIRSYYDFLLNEEFDDVARRIIIPAADAYPKLEASFDFPHVLVQVLEATHFPGVQQLAVSIV